MDPSIKPAAFHESIRGDRSRVRVSLVIAAALIVVGLGLAGNLAAPGGDGTAVSLPPASAPAAATTPRATRGPTPPGPTPAPTLAPMIAAITTAELAPTGLVRAGVGDPAVRDPVPDVNGSAWAIRSDGVVNVDPRTGRTRAWTIADDPAFAANSLAPARQGGVWLVTEEAIRLFDGERFSAVIDTPEPVWVMAEDADGSLWAQTDRYGLIRWANGTWASDPPGRPTRGAAQIVVDGAGRVWTLDFDRRADGEWIPRGVSAWDGSQWISYGAADLPDMRVSGWSATSLVAAGDGSVWLALGDQVARFRAEGSTGRWVRYDVGEIGVRATLSAIGHDGRLWFTMEDCDSCGVRILVYDGSTLTDYDEDDGLPGAVDVSWPGATVLPEPGYVLATTDAGLYRLMDGSWQRLGPSAPSGAPAPWLTPSGEVTALAATSRDEVWVTTAPADRDATASGGSGLFAYDGSTWRRQQQPAGTTVGQAIVDPDGILWVATSSGPLVRRGGAWTDLGETVAALVPEPDEVTDGCGSIVFAAGAGVVYYAGPRSGGRLVAVQLVGGAWEATLGPDTPVCSETFAVTTDGTIWRLQRWWGSVLSRWTEEEGWQTVSLPKLDELDTRPGTQLDPSAIVADAEGSLWVAVNAWSALTDTPRVDVLQLTAGQWTWRGGGDGMVVSALALLPDGSLIVVGDGVATLDGPRWHHLWHGFWLTTASVAPDGAVWVAGSNVYRLPTVLP